MTVRIHPLSRATYTVRADGLLDVESTDGIGGVFDAKGRRVEGKLAHVDPQFCGWLAGPQLPADVPGNPKDFPTPAKATAASNIAGAK